MAVNIYRYSRRDKLGRQALYLRVITNEGKIIVPLKIKVKPQQWSEHKKRVINHPLQFEFNEKLQKIKDVSYNAHDLYKADIITFSELRGRILGKDTRKTIKALMDVFSKEKNALNYRNYLQCIKRFEEYLGHYPSFTDIDYSTLSGFVAYHKKKGSKASTVNAQLRMLSSILNDANERGFTNHQYKPSRTLFLRAEERVISTLSSNLFRTAINNATTDYEVEGLIMYLLSFICCGAYYDDLKELTPKTDYFEYVRHKTRVKSFVNGCEGLVVDLYNAIPKDKLYSSSKQIKGMQKLTGVTFKTARKTLDSVALAEGIDTSIRFRLLAQAEPSVKKAYTDFEMTEVRRKIIEAQEKVFKAWNVYDTGVILLNKLQALKSGLPNTSVATSKAIEGEI